jgi:hypothetical protein
MLYVAYCDLYVAFCLAHVVVCCMMHDAHCSLCRQVNQCEMSVKTRDEATIAYCQQKGIVYEVPFCAPARARVCGVSLGCGCGCVCARVCAYMRLCACVCGRCGAFRPSKAELALTPALGTLLMSAYMLHARTHACMPLYPSLPSRATHAPCFHPEYRVRTARRSRAVCVHRCVSAPLQRSIAHRRSSP